MLCRVLVLSYQSTLSLGGQWLTSWAATLHTCDTHGLVASSQITLVSTEAVKSKQSNCVCPVWWKSFSSVGRGRSAKSETGPEGCWSPGDWYLPFHVTHSPASAWGISSLLNEMASCISQISHNAFTSNHVLEEHAAYQWPWWVRAFFLLHTSLMPAWV